MWRKKFVILFIVPWVAVAAPSAASNDDHLLPGEKFFKGLPEDEQPDYLSFELGRGYLIETESEEPRYAMDGDVLIFPDALDIPDELVEKFEALEVPENFTENLFDFVKTEFKLDIPSVRTLILRRRVCFEDGFCLNLDDVGSFCCPF